MRHRPSRTTESEFLDAIEAQYGPIPSWPPCQNPSWGRSIPEDQWVVYEAALQAAAQTGTRWMLGGAFGLAGYTGRLRNTKDMDFYILPSQRETMIEALKERGFEDLYDRMPYDRNWIYRATRDGVIVDLIWAMANRRAEVDPSWFEHTHRIRFRSVEFDLIPVEELFWCKLYVLQRDRSDWPDLMNLLYAVGPNFNFPRLRERLQEDAPLAFALFQVFSWLCPGRAAQFPQDELEAMRKATAGVGQERIRLLDSRPWFAALQPEDKILEI